MKLAIAGDSAGEGLAKVLADHLKDRFACTCGATNSFWGWKIPSLRMNSPVVNG